MVRYIDFYSVYVMGSVQTLLGFYFLAKLLHKKIRLGAYILFAVCGIGVISLIQVTTSFASAGLGVYVLLLLASGKLLLRAGWKSVVLYTALVVEVMQLCYGLVSILQSICYPLLSGFDQRAVGILLMLCGDAAALLLSGACCYFVWRYFSYYEAVKKQYVFLVLIPVLMIFIMNGYIHSVVYGCSVSDSSGLMVSANHCQMFIMQLLAIASLFCILFSYKKLLASVCLSSELSLLEQEEHFLNQYVEQAREHYEKTKAFRHDVKNHMAVLKKLLQSGKLEQAFTYIRDMDEMAEELSFSCSTNNPVVDILAGKKLGIAAGMGIDVDCPLVLPYPCGVRDIDLCIILSNALDNAIHACKKMEDGAQKYIRVSGRLQGDFLLIEVANSFQGSGIYRQGTGLSNVKTIAEKYHGAMSIKVQDQVFLLHVLLILPGKVFEKEEL